MTSRQKVVGVGLEVQACSGHIHKLTCNNGASLKLWHRISKPILTASYLNQFLINKTIGNGSKNMSKRQANVGILSEQHVQNTLDSTPYQLLFCIRRNAVNWLQQLEHKLLQMAAAPKSHTLIYFTKIMHLVISHVDIKHENKINSSQ